MKAGTYAIDVKRNYFHKKPIIHFAKTGFILSDPSALIPLINPSKADYLCIPSLREPLYLLCELIYFSLFLCTVIVNKYKVNC
tara:strand:- start:897 stop:1145 length:249 start_codon:yes stop_codon:yes gene_type:complete